MVRNRRVNLDGNDYIWNGTDWYDAKTFLTPPQIVVRRLNALLERDLTQEDATLSNVSLLIKRASEARDTLQIDRAHKLIRRALSLSPGNLAALAVLCSILRARGRPQQALGETEAHKETADSPLLTSRAAALCDLKRWKEAKKEIGRALSIEKSQEAFNVVMRIKAARPDLY